VAARGRCAEPAMPLVGLINAASLETSSVRLAAFRAGLGETGYIDGQNVAIEHHHLEGQFDRLPALLADLVRRRVAVIATPSAVAATLAAKAATATIPIVFGVNDNPVRLGLVASLARPGGNATGMNSFANEATPKRLGLLHELVPKANRVAVLIDPNNSAVTEATLREVQDAARLIGLPIDILKAGTSREIEEAFATMVRERTEALFVGTDAFFFSRQVQFATLATLHRIPTHSASASMSKPAG
jgi:putative tryptophan/tyrosine transport system substrate-binding protein